MVLVHTIIGGCFWDELAGLGSICGDKWCIGVDFNVVRDVKEKFNSTSYKKHENF